MNIIQLLLVSFIHVAWSQTLRVACRTGHPPFSDWSTEQSKCVGYTMELFSLAAQEGGFAYTMSKWTQSSRSALVINTTTNTSLFDITVSLTSIVPEALVSIDYSLPFLDLAYGCSLVPSFSPERVSLARALTARSVLYITSLILLFILGSAVVTLIAESLNRKSKVREIQNFGRRMLWCLEHAMDFNWESPYASSWSRSLRTAIVLIMMFLVTIFGSVISANMTSEVIRSQTPEVSVVQGGDVYSAETQLNDYLVLLGAHPVAVSDIGSQVGTWRQNRSSTIDGFCSTYEEVKYLHQHHGLDKENYVLTKDFLVFGLPASKAFGLSKALPRDIIERFNVALRKLRDNGTSAQLLTKYVNSDPLPTQEDIPIATPAYIGVLTTTAVVFFLFIVVVIVVRIKYHFDEKKRQQNVEESMSQIGPRAATLVIRVHGVPTVHTVKHHYVTQALELCTSKGGRQAPFGESVPNVDVPVQL